MNINHDSTLILNTNLTLSHIFASSTIVIFSHKTNNTRVRTSALHKHPCFHDPCTIFHAQATLLYSPTTVYAKNSHPAGVCPRSEPADPGGQSKGHAQTQSHRPSTLCIGESSDSDRSHLWCARPRKIFWLANQYALGSPPQKVSRRCLLMEMLRLS